MDGRSVLGSGSTGPGSSEPPVPYLPAGTLEARLISLDREIRRLGRLENLSRRLLGKLALRWRVLKAHHKIGSPRLGDYTRTHFGLSGSAFQEAAKVELRLEELPRIAAAFEAGRISWSKLEILTAVATPETDQKFADLAPRATVRELEEALRAARRAREDGAASLREPEQKESWENYSAAAHPKTVAKFEHAIESCRRIAGQQLPRWQAVDYIAADVLAGCGIGSDNPWADKLAAYDWKQGLGREQDGRAHGTDAVGQKVPSEDAGQISELEPLSRFARRDLEQTTGYWQGLEWNMTDTHLPPEIDRLGDGLGDADAHELHHRIVRLLVFLQGIEAKLAGLVRRFRNLGGPEALRFFDARHYLEQRAGVPARRGWHYSRIRRWYRRSRELARAYGDGAIHAEHAEQVDRILYEEPAPQWIERAQATDLPRLEREVTQIMCGHLEAQDVPREWHRIQFRAPESVIWQWQAALFEAQRFVPQEKAIDWLLDAFLSQIPEKVPREHRIFERDGWMCQAPGCFSRCGLQAHHVIPRSQGGGNEDANLLTLCFWCHHHGVHGRKLRCAGRAPGDLAWVIGWRSDGPPLLRFRNGTKLPLPIAHDNGRRLQSLRGKGTESSRAAAHGTAAARA